MHFGAVRNPGGNFNVYQASTFHTGNLQLVESTAHSACRSTALSGIPLFVYWNGRVPVASLSTNAAQIASIKSPHAPISLLTILTA